MIMNEPNLRRLVEKAARRSLRRWRPAQQHGVRERRLFKEAMNLQDHLSMAWNAAAMAPAEAAIHQSRQLAREELDMPYASDREVDNATYRRLR